MLQEDGTVAFDTMEVYVPWYIGVFRLYLAFVLLLAILRLARFLWALRKQRTARNPVRNPESTAGSPVPALRDLAFQARSFRTLTQLTLLITVAVFAWALASASLQVATQKTTGVGAVAGALADALGTFAAGVGVSTAVFCCGALCERLIHRHRLRQMSKAN